MFDADRLLDAAEGDDGGQPRPGAHGASRGVDDNDDRSRQRRPPPPAYSAFTLSVGEGEEESPGHLKRPSKKPSLLQRGSSAQAPLVADVAVGKVGALASDESGTYVPGSNVTSTIATSLRQKLEQQHSKNGSDSDSRDGAGSGSPGTNTSTGTTPARQAAKAKSVRAHEPNHEDASQLTRQYWLRPYDSLMSLSLRFGVNAVELCKLNELPPSTASSTPHLIHTRQFLLIPERAIAAALSRASSEPNTAPSSSDADTINSLESALRGPAPMSCAQKIRRARREAQGRFRALVAQNEGRSRISGFVGEPSVQIASPAGLASLDVTPCDDRAAKAYILLMEAELRHVDFGDGVVALEQTENTDANLAKDKKTSISSEDDSDGDGDDALCDVARQRRYDAVVQQAVARWAMDSDWERRQRAEGLEPTTQSLPHKKEYVSGSGKRYGEASRSSAAASSSGVFDWLRPRSTRTQAGHEPLRWKTVHAPSQSRILPPTALASSSEK